MPHQMSGVRGFWDGVDAGNDVVLELGDVERPNKGRFLHVKFLHRRTNAARWLLKCKAVRRWRVFCSQ